MALIKCIECENEVSDKAKTCPKCGAPVELSIVPSNDLSSQQSPTNTTYKSGSFMNKVIIVIIILVLLMLMQIIFKNG